MAGILQVWVIGAKSLKNVETIGRMDPYCKVVLGGQSYKTKVETDAGRTPVWNEQFTLNVTDAERESMYLEVKDKDTFGSKLIGIGKISISGLGAERVDGWHDIFDPNNKPAGQVQVGLRLVRGTTASAVPVVSTSSVAIPPNPPSPHQQAPPMPYGANGYGAPAKAGFAPPMPIPGVPTSMIGGAVITAYGVPVPTTTTPQQFVVMSPPRPPQPAPYSPPMTQQQQPFVYGMPGPYPGPQMMMQPQGPNGYAPPGTVMGVPAPGPAQPFSYGGPPVPQPFYGAMPPQQQQQQAPMAPYGNPYGAPQPVTYGVNVNGGAPSQPQPQQTVLPTSPGMPYGWEQRTSPDGRTYYVDHATKTTHWTPPAAPPAYAM